MTEADHIKQNGPTAAILAGGRSSRMGRDKAAIPVGDETFLERTVRIVGETGLRTIVVGRERPANWRYEEVRFVEDDYPGRGPLGGLLTAMHAVGTDILLLPCDMPDLTSDAVRWLLAAGNRLSETGRGLVPVNNGRPEPMFALYPATLAERCRNVLESGSGSLREVIAEADTHLLELPARHASALRNVNRPDQLHQNPK